MSHTSSTLSSGNVFEDLGFDQSESKYLLAKSRIMAALTYVVKSNGWTQAQAAEAFGVHQPDVSDLMTGKLSRFTVDRLLKMVDHAGFEVNVEIVGLEYA